MSLSGRCDHCAHALPAGVPYCPECGAVASLNTPTGEAPVRVAAFLLVQVPGRVVTKVALSRPIVRIGRGRDCEVVADHPRISRVHAIIELRSGAWHLSDARSTGGTFLGEKPVHGATPLRSGDAIRLGREPGDSVSIVFHLGE
jgi:hypothetical protein